MNRAKGEERRLTRASRAAMLTPTGGRIGLRRVFMMNGAEVEKYKIVYWCALAESSRTANYSSALATIVTPIHPIPQPPVQSPASFIPSSSNP